MTASRSAMLIPKPTERQFDAILITDSNMHPTFPINSVVFLGEPRYSSLFLFYALFREGKYCGIYRVKRCNDGVSFSLDGWPTQHQPSFVVPIEEARSMDVRLVEGVTMPFSLAFSRFLNDRFRDCREDWS